jgi:hypothetical protein
VEQDSVLAVDDVPSMTVVLVRQSQDIHIIFTQRIGRWRSIMTEDEAIHRLEFENRQAELRLEMRSIESDIKGQFLNMNTKIDALTVQVTRRSLDLWKIGFSSTISFIVGYALQYLQHFIH